MPIEDLDLEFPDSAEAEFKELVSEMKKLRYENNVEQHIGSGSSPGVINSWLPLERVPDIDKVLTLQLRNRSKSRDDFTKARESLPVYRMREAILKKIETNRVIVVRGQAGCGKTTQIPQYILDDYISKNNGSLCRIVCTQPRRISAIGIAERVAKERNEHLGEGSSVGYQIRLDSKMPRENGSIVYCTTGIMFKWLFKDPHLSSYSHVILDEVHERSLETDILLIMLRELMEIRTNLKLILMSATMNAEAFCQYFDNCPIINVPGLCHPVEKLMLEDILEMTNFCCSSKGTPPPYMKDFVKTLDAKYSPNTIKVLRGWDEEQINFELMIELLKYIHYKEPMGAVLIFLPGWEDISMLHSHLMDDCTFNTPFFSFVLLHSQIPIENQQNVFINPPRGVRKIVISTDIAETSITIDDVVYVIDCGKVKTTNFDTRRNILTLNLCWIAKSNAEQRKGRAGRLQPGKCYHLFTSYRENEMEEYRCPEILRTRLVNICLRIKTQRFDDIRKLFSKAMDKPSPGSVEMTVELLKALSALDSEENLTPLGSILAQLPLNPRLGKMILFGAIFSCLNPILTIAAALEHKSPFYSLRNQQKSEKRSKSKLSANSESDHIAVARAFELWENARSKSKFCAENFLVESTLDMLAKLRCQFVNDLYNLGFLLKNDPNHPSANINSNNIELVKGIICAGLYPNLAIKLCDGCFTVENGRVYLHPQSIQQQRSGKFSYKWLVYFNKMQTSKVYLYDTTVISNILLFLFGGNLKIEDMLMDEWIRITTKSTEDYTTFVNIRETLTSIINDVIKRKRVLEWDSLNPEVKFLDAIITHFTSPEKERNTN